MSRTDDFVQDVDTLLSWLDYPMSDDNFKGTPARMAAWLMSFAHRDVERELADLFETTFPEDHHELVIVRDISFVALCAHHVLPYWGKAHIGYVPNGRVVGLSKLARAVKLVAHQLTLQERITRQLADAVYQDLGCQGVMVVLDDVSHGCMSFRGVEDDHARTVTSAVRGIFDTNKDGVKDEFLRLIAR